MIITIDGPVATGKSTIAKQLAKSIGYIYFDTGAMYRALTWALLKNNIPLDDESRVKEYLDHFNFDIKVKHGEKKYYVDNEDISLAIRGDEVTSHVSKVAALSEVRTKLVAIQRELAMGVNAVFEGRDMGTTVFPNAELKIFLAGDAKVRAERRYKELCEKFPDQAEQTSLEKVLEEITARDEYDSSRKTSPLKKADDAHLIDTTNLTIDEVVYKILECKDSKRAKSHG